MENIYWQNIRQLIDLYKRESSESFLSVPIEYILCFYHYILEAYNNERAVFACGNGGNVASVQNFVLDLNMHPFVSEDKRLFKDIHRNRFHAVSLCDSSAAITGMTNDVGFKNIFVEQLKYQAREKDVLFAMSGSGNSENIVEALKFARTKNMKTVLITRAIDTKSDPYSDLILRVQGISNFPGNTGPNNNNFHYEDIISKISHIVVGLLKKHVNENPLQ